MDSSGNSERGSGAAALAAAAVSIIATALPFVILLSAGSGSWQDFPSDFKHAIALALAGYLIAGAGAGAALYARGQRAPAWLAYAAAPGLAMVLAGMALISGGNAQPEEGRRGRGGAPLLAAMLALIALMLLATTLLLTGGLLTPNTLAKTALGTLASAALLWGAATAMRARAEGTEDARRVATATRALAHLCFLSGALCFLVLAATLVPA